MSMTLELTEDVEAVLMFHARAARMPTERYLANLVERAVESRRRAAADQLGEHLDSMAAQIVPATTAEQMEAALEEALIAVRPHRVWHE
jgi:hypothetical protein